MLTALLENFSINSCSLRWCGDHQGILSFPRVFKILYDMETCITIIFPGPSLQGAHLFSKPRLNMATLAPPPPPPPRVSTPFLLGTIIRKIHLIVLKIWISTIILLYKKYINPIFKF